ncbi:VOC family protein [Aurantimonas sp. MSK8Z-1]|uniref:VOC family protein n=1 Tax=Mangrovibrevibacter kandeliae TaxID=2968473 RepID=UPI002118970B|nr:VOC family protein [Aurantimonas sp. MSK8Z-1]MCW4113954.1 VOC family protein [Aurantimonas sp. MSK8Z-1]
MDHEHLGRLIDHIHVRCRDFAAASRFYAAILAALGHDLTVEDDHAFCDEFFLDAGPTPSRIHLAFQAANEAQVSAFHAAGLAAGGRDNGAPGPRDYHPGYYAAFLLDPDGNNIEAVWHGPRRRSAEAVTVTRI